MLNGKIGFVTGGASGLGRATALAMARAGADVALVDLNTASMQPVASEIHKLGRSAVAIAADITDETEIGRAVQQAIDQLGGLDCAYNSAGIALPYQAFDTMPSETFDRVIRVNLRGVALSMQAQIRAMLAHGKGGTIVNASSALGLVAGAGQSAYTASKHGVTGLTKAAAVEYAARGIRINAICPGFIETPMTHEDSKNAAYRTAVLAAHPIGRFGTANEVADVVVWLCSPFSSFVAGAAIPVDGGLTAQ